MKKTIKWEKFIPIEERDFYGEAQVELSNVEQDALDSFNLNHQNLKYRPASIYIDDVGNSFSVHEAKMSRKHYNIWTGHTNFPIMLGQDDRLIASFLGVTTFSWNTTYCFRIGIGKNFQAEEVRQSIQKFFNGFPYAKVQNIEEKERFTIICDDTPEKVLEKVELCFHQRRLNNLVITSWSTNEENLVVGSAGIDDVGDDSVANDGDTSELSTSESAGQSA